MLSLPDHDHAPVPVVNVWLCRLVCTVTVAGLPFGSTETVNATFGPFADVAIARLRSGPYGVTATPALALHGLPDPAPPVLPLHARRFSVTDWPFGRPLTVWVNPACPPAGYVHVP